MSFPAEFLTMMPSTMSVYDFVSFDNYGAPTYSTTATGYRCRMEYTPTKVAGAQGEEIVWSNVAYVASTSALNVLAQYILPDTSTGIVQSISQMYDEDGIHHNVVHFGAGI